MGMMVVSQNLCTRILRMTRNNTDFKTFFTLFSVSVRVIRPIRVQAEPATPGSCLRRFPQIRGEPKIFWLVFALFLVACAPSTPPNTLIPPGDGEVIATAVAQQLTAAVQWTVPPPSAETPVPAVTSKPTKTSLKVVYSTNSGLRLWDGATVRPLTDSGADARPQISDDGQIVAFSRAGELWAVSADGSNPRALADSGTLANLPRSAEGKPEVSQFVFAPGSHDVYFNTILMTESYPIAQYDLAKVNADAPVVQSLLKNGDGGKIVFAPDGRKIALVQPEKINVVNADGSGSKTVFTFKMVSTYSEWFYLPEIAWMPDASGFKTVIPASDPLANPKKRTRFYFVPASGGKAAQLAEFLAAPVFQSGVFISPDGTKVLYGKEQGGNLELHVIDASTADKMYFWQPRDKFGPRGWTPDSQGLLYWRDDTRRTWLLAADGQASPLSDVTYATSVAWVDANRYLFVNETELRLRTLGQPSLLVDADFSGNFDFVLLPEAK
jgi:hypothetical protein